MKIALMLVGATVFMTGCVVKEEYHERPHREYIVEPAPTVVEEKVVYPHHHHHHHEIEEEIKIK